MSVDTGENDDTVELLLDNSLNIYIVGSTNNGVTDDVLTLKYDTNGNQIWNTTFDGGENENGYGIALDSSGNVYLVGETYDGISYDYLALKYAQE